MTVLARLKSLPWLPIVVIGLMLLRLVAAGGAGLVPDEAYYWLWAQHPAPGYYDHPPMVAWWIAAMPFTDMAPLLVRLPFVLSFAVLCWLVYDTGKTLFSKAVARRSLLWLNACLLLGIGSVVATPDPPSVLMWAAGLWALAKLQASGNGRWWLVFGLFAGLGVEAKYTNLFLGLGVLVWIVLDKGARKWLLSPWLWAGGVVAALVMAPNLIWNAQHGWITFAKQFGRIEAGQFTVKYLVEFLISQPLLVNPLIFVFVVLGVLAWWKNRDDARLALLVALPLPLTAYMLIHVFHDRIQGNWPAPVYPGLVLLAAVAAEGTDRSGWARTWAAPVGIGLSAIVLVYMSLGSVLPQMAGAAGLSQGWDRVYAQANDKAHQAGADWIVTTDYNTQAELSYHHVLASDHAIIPLAERQRYPWDAYGMTVGSRALIISARDIDLSRCFTDVQDLGTVSRLKRPGRKSDFRLHTGLLKSADCDLDSSGRQAIHR